MSKKPAPGETGYLRHRAEHPPKKKDLLAGRDLTSQLYRAVRRYVESGGGTIVVIGGIEVQEWPGENAGVYRLAVKFMGRKPEFPKGETS